MKTKTFLLAILACCAFACDKEETKDNTEEKTTIDGQEFNPTEASVVNNGKSLWFMFVDDTKSIEIMTNDTIEGTYEITNEELKSTALLANLAYTDDTTVYMATSGSVTIKVEEDGVISGTYSATVVSEDDVELTVSSGVFTEMDVEFDFEEEKPPVITAESINDTLTVCYDNLKSYVELSYMFDAVYSNKTAAPNTSWDAVYAHTSNTLDANVKQMWQNAYDNILRANFILENAESYITDQEEFIQVVAQAKALRGYTYYTLLTWFGELPLPQVYRPESWVRSQEYLVMMLVIDDASSALEYLPVSWEEPNDYKITKAFVQALLCRAYLYSESYTQAYNMTQDIVNSQNYSLDVSVDNITDQSSEVFWGFAKGDNEVFNTFFTKGSYVPVMRYTEVLLISAESSYQLGNLMEAANYINMLKSRRQEAEIIQITAEDIYAQWNTELEQEGSMFVTMKRFGKVGEVLQIPEFKNHLPIPQYIIDSNPNMTQNPGY